MLPKRESSRRKAKENLSKKIQSQERLVEEDDEVSTYFSQKVLWQSRNLSYLLFFQDALPGLDLSDSDDDATWTPFKDKEKADNPALGRHKRYVGMVSNESFSFLHTNTEGFPNCGLVHF